ncbi:BTB/POZ domain-containing protein [Capsicum chinense]|nr:BTB/POZ domain-containing protein [Capsicum chinense]
MDPDYSPTCTRELDFAFAFNNSNFSDCVLWTEIFTDSIDGVSDSSRCNSLTNWARNQKRHREDFKRKMHSPFRINWWFLLLLYLYPLVFKLFGRPYFSQDLLEIASVSLRYEGNGKIDEDSIHHIGVSSSGNYDSWEMGKLMRMPCTILVQVYQSNKDEHLSPIGLLQLLALPEKVWADIGMDFMNGLPKAWGNTVLFVVVDRFSKYTHFIPMSHPYNANHVAYAFFEHSVLCYIHSKLQQAQELLVNSYATWEDASHFHDAYPDFELEDKFFLEEGGDEATNSDDSTWNCDSPRVMKFKTLHISSPILAVKSPFLYKLFSNGMRESEQRQVTLRINASEESALMELLNFIYSNTLTINTAPTLLDVLMDAYKFEVASCMRYCSRLLCNLPMTPESALLYLELPSSVLMADAVHPLTDAAKQFLAARYKDITKFQEEVMKLPLAGIEAILSSYDLLVASEDAVYDFVLKCTRAHYHLIDEFLVQDLLRKVLTCNDFKHEFASKLVVEALFYKAKVPQCQRAQAAEESALTSRCFVDRAYKYRPVKVVEFELPRFFLFAHCNMDQQSSFHCFGLFLGMQEKGSVSFVVDYEFAARTKPAEEYVSKYKRNYNFTEGKTVDYRNLFAIP